MRKISLNGLFCPKSFEIKQLLRAMKITLFLLLFVTFQAYCGNSYSQNAKVNIPSSQLRVGQVLSQIESQTEYLFVYNKKSVDVRRTVNVEAEGKSVAELLDEVFAGTSIKYVMEGKNIVLTKKSENTENTDGVQQERVTVKGVVTDSKGEPIIGANILEKGTTNGIITNLDGEFTLNAPANATLVISYIGYEPISIALNGRTSLKVQMKEEALALETVVVTAMGIKKKEASLTYSTQQVGGDELTRAKDPNMINALAGKTAGVSITRNASGLGGSAKVSIRGIRSANADGNNQPLYVIDGVPMLNSVAEQAYSAMGGNNDAGNRDSGDGISNLNPDDIESMSILKGASAAALYGSQAANGVILITTKKGKAGMQRIVFNSNLTVDHAICLPEFQDRYGASGATSWGTEDKNLKAYNNVDDYFSNGVTATNSLSIMTGKEKMQTYFSYANTTAKGIVDVNKLQKHNITFRETASLFNDRLTLDANVNLMTQKIKNRPTSGGYYMNPLVGLYTFPRGEDLSAYRDNNGFEKYDENRAMPLQNWYTDINGFNQNPYWLTNRVTSNDKRFRTLAALSANLKINDWFSIQARGNVDYINDNYEQKMYAGTAADVAHQNGRYIKMNRQDFMIYGDVMAMFNKTWNDWTLNAAIGSSINTTKVNSLSLDSGKSGLYKANVFTVPNMNLGGAGTSFIDETANQRRTIQSLFATAQIGWKESIYLDVTARNDWSSTLANTKSENSGFFYPSVGLSWIINKTLNLPEWISFGKVRASWAQVGNDLPIGITSPAQTITAGGVVQPIDYYFAEDLKPEISNSIEVGTEWKFFDYRMDVDLTFYKTNTKNQLFSLPSSAGAAYKYYFVNAGNIQNMGVELTFGAVPILTNQFKWNTTLNFSRNKNEVKKLHDDLASFIQGDEGFSSSYTMRLVEGGSFGDIYGKAFERDKYGAIVYGRDGLPQEIGSGNTAKVGNCNPAFLLGWGNSFTYKDFSFYFLIDGHFGGDVLAQTQAVLDQTGVSKVSGEARTMGYVDLEGHHIYNIKGFYEQVGGRNGVTEYYMYDATNIRLRELSLGYTLPKRLLGRKQFVKKAELSFVARNLFFIYKKAPFDPDAVLSASNSNQGIDIFGIPTTRSVGFNVKLSF